MASVTKSITILAAALMAVGCASLDPASSTATTSAAGDLKTAAAKAPLTAAEIQVVTAQFGVFGADPSGRRLLYETDKFPAIPAAPYGWYILFKTSKPTVVWREEFECPRHLRLGVRVKRWGFSVSRPIARLRSRSASSRPGWALSRTNGATRRAIRLAPTRCACTSTVSWFANSASISKKVRKTSADLVAGRIAAIRSPRHSSRPSRYAATDTTSGASSHRLALSQTFCSRLTLTGIGVFSS